MTSIRRELLNVLEQCKERLNSPASESDRLLGTDHGRKIAIREVNVLSAEIRRQYKGKAIVYSEDVRRVIGGAIQRMKHSIK